MGGLIAGGSYLIRGGPGTGKTMLGLHFLTEGAARDESVLLISLAETERRIRRAAISLGFDLDKVRILDLSPNSEFFAEAQSYDLFSPAEIDREPITRKIVGAVETYKPNRIFLDSITQFRYLSANDFQFRLQILSFMRFLLEQETTVLFSSETMVKFADDDLQFMADGILNLTSSPDGRALDVGKFRGSEFRSGEHTLVLGPSGAAVFPKLIPEHHAKGFRADALPFGIPELDAQLFGGIERGTVTILTGPSGVGKTTLGVQFMDQGASRGERSVVYTFSEEPEIILRRAESLGIPARGMTERGTLSLVKVEPLQYSPDEFASLVRTEVESMQARIVMIDSVAGYRLSLRGADLIYHLHALTKYLQNMGVATLLINELEAVSGEFRATEVGASYLADNIVFMRYLERHEGRDVELRRGIGVLKKRLTDFDRKLHEIAFSASGIQVSRALTGVSTILGIAPTWEVDAGRP